MKTVGTVDSFKYLGLTPDNFEQHRKDTQKRSDQRLSVIRTLKKTLCIPPSSPTVVHKYHPAHPALLLNGSPATSELLPPQIQTADSALSAV